MLILFLSVNLLINRKWIWVLAQRCTLCSSGKSILLALDVDEFFIVTFISFIFFCLNSCLRYKEAKAKGVDNYDRELEDAIDRLIVECDRKIGRALKRLQEEDAKAAIAISVTEVTQVMF